MGKFVESAILKVIDQSSRNINKISKALKGLREEGKRLKNINVNINTSKVAKATAEFNRLGKSIKTVTSPKIGMSNVNTTLAGLRKIQSQVQKLNSTAVNIRVRGGQGGAGGGGGRVPRVPGGGGQGGGGSWRINASALDIWAAGFIYRLGHTIESSITAGFREGTQRINQSYLRNNALGYTPEQIAEVDRQSYRLARKNPNFAPSDFRTLYAEVGPTLGNDPRRVTPLMEMASDYANSRLTQTGDPDKALEGVRSIFKALDNINRLQDNDGNISGKAEDYLRVMIEESILSGADITPEKINTAAIYARTTGKTLTPEGYRTLIANTESMGRVAGSSLNRFVENLSGNTTAKAIAEQAEWGLVEMKQTQVGTNSKGKPKFQNAWESTAGGELLRKDPNAWAVQELIPRLEKRGIDINNPAAVANALAPLMGSVVAKDMALNLVTWQGEYQKRLEAASSIPSNEDQRNLVNNNGYLALISVGRQTVEVLGEIGTTITDKLIGPLGWLRQNLIDLSEYLGGGDRNLTAASVVGGTALAGGVTAMWAGSKAMSFLRSPLVFATGLDTATTALGRFTLAVNGASGGAAADGLTDLGGGKKGGVGRRLNITATAVSLTAVGTLAYGITSAGKDAIANNPDMAAKEAAANERNLNNVKAIKDFFSDNAVTRFFTDAKNTVASYYGNANPNGSLPGTENISQQKPDWRSFLFGTGESLKDALGIEINSAVETGVENTGNKMLDTFTQGAALISSGGNDLGTTAGQALLSIAGPFGAAVAAAMQANFNPGTLQVQVSAPATANTGANTNNAR